jgi:hypothetical protein
MLIELFVHFDGRNPDPAEGFGVVTSLQREGLFPLSVGSNDVLWDGCAVVVDRSATVESGVSGHLRKALHCNTSA